MPLEQVASVRLIAPRSELLQVTRDLVALQYFHPKEDVVPEPDRKLESILSNLRRVFVEIQEAASDSGLKDDVPIMEQLLKGYKIDRNIISVKDWQELAAHIASQADPLLISYRAMRGQLANLEKEIREKASALLSLKGLESLNYNLETIEKMKWVRLFLFTTQTRNVHELKQALTDLIVKYVQTTPDNSLVLVVGSVRDADRVNRTIRVFDAKPITMPKGAPPNPLEAHKELFTSIEKLNRAADRIRQKLSEFAHEKGQNILMIKEASKLVLSNLERLRKPVGFKRAVVVEGYIPHSKLSEFEERMSKWVIRAEEGDEHLTHGHMEGREPSRPTVLRNRGYFKAFEKITLTQGPPTSGELDPTPLIGVVFPIFYGLMFGDVGHGLILTLFGLFMLKRTAPTLKPWAVMLTSFGISATISGLMVGEYFGLHGHEVPVLGQVLEPIHKFGVKIGLTVESEEIPRLLGLTILIGAVHLSLGFALDVMRKLRLGNKYEAITMSLPTFVWYVLGAIPFGIGLVQVNVDLRVLGSSQLPHPLFPLLTVGAVTNYIVLPTTAVCSIAIVLSHPLGVLLHKHHGPMGDAVILGPIEWLLRVIEFLANSISYVRIGILLIIHATLVGVVRGFTYDNILLLPAAVIFNILVMALEGLIVYIQALRLHLYEWFTKFYDGTGTLFEGLILEGRRVKIQLTD